MLSRVSRMYLQLRIQPEPLQTEGHLINASGDEDSEDMMTVHFLEQTTTEEDPLLQTELHTEEENLTGRDLHFPGAVTGPNTEDEQEEPETPPNVAGVVLVIVSTAVFALAEHYFGLCTAAGVKTSHLLLFRSVYAFTLNLGAMACLAFVKSYELNEPQQSQVTMKSRVPTLIMVGLAATLATVITPMSYLFDLPRESFQTCILSLAPTYTTAIAYCFLSEKFAKEKLWTIGVCFVGTFLFITGIQKPVSGPETSPEKCVIAILLPQIVSTAFVGARALLKNNVHPTILVFAVQLTTILYLLPFNMKFLYETASSASDVSYSLDAWQAAIGHVICHTSATYLLCFALKLEKAGIVQVLLSVAIPFSLLLDYAMFGRVPFTSQAVGGALTAVGVAALVVMTCLENKLCTGIGNIVHAT